MVEYKWKYHRMTRRDNFDGQKYADTASEPLKIRQIFPARLFLPDHITTRKTTLYLPVMDFRGIFSFGSQEG